MLVFKVRAAARHLQADRANTDSYPWGNSQLLFLPQSFHSFKYYFYPDPFQSFSPQIFFCFFSENFLLKRFFLKNNYFWWGRKIQKELG